MQNSRSETRRYYNGKAVVPLPFGNENLKICLRHKFLLPMPHLLQKKVGASYVRAYAGGQGAVGGAAADLIQQACRRYSRTLLLAVPKT